MKKSLKLLVLSLVAFSIGFGASNYALSNEPSKIAVVDIADIVASSSQVKALKKDQDAKMKEIVSFLEKARKEIASTTDVNKKKALEEKYTKELNAKKEVQEKAYLDKLSEIDKKISEKITETAKSQNYDVVLTKKVVLYGGTDITDEIKKAINK